MRYTTRNATRWACIAAPTLIFFVFLGARASANPGDVMSTGAPVKGPDRPNVTTVPSGTWGVSETTGAAEFSIPIFTPAGRRGMQPSLSLVYSSHNPIRGGIAVGWQLPIDAISVDTSEGRLAGTTYTSSLVGGQRLVQVPEPAFAGRTDVITYRGEHDAGYLRFEHVLGGESPVGYWRVRSPTGVTQYFGESADSRDQPTSGGESYASEGRWFLTRSVDRPASELDTPNREVQVPISLDPDTLEVDTGYSVATRRMVDLDGDGLVDMFSAPVPSTGTTNPWVHVDPDGDPDHAVAYVNVGDRLLPLGPSAKLDAMRDALERITLTYDQKWHVKTDFFDFDGDAEVFNADHDYNGNSIVDLCNPDASGEWTAFCGYTNVVTRDSRTGAQGMHMLQRIDNGYGASVTFTYAPTTEVAPSTLGGRRAPAPVWVVTTMAVDPGLAAPGQTPVVATSTYDYSGPVYNADDRGHYGFRGFEQVIARGPINADGHQARSVTRYDYRLDPTGRKVESVTSDEAGKPLSITRWTWDAFSLFGGLVRTYETTEKRRWICGASAASEAGCRATAPVHRSLKSFAPVTASTELDALGRMKTSLGGSGTPIAWIAAWSALMDHEGAIATGDRGGRFEYAVYYGTDAYQTLFTRVEQQVATGPGGEEQFGAMRVFGRDDTIYDDTGLGFPVVSRRWTDESTVATIERELDPKTGLEVARTRPNQVGASTPKKILTSYDPNRVYPERVLNELGRGAIIFTDVATGAPLTTTGPGQPGRTPVVQNDYDALGRLIETRRTTESSGTNLVTVAKTTYDDTSTPRQVTSQTLVDSSKARWSQTTTTVDPLDRPLTVTEPTSGGFAVSTYEYDGAGNVVGVTSPSPADNTSVVTTRYHYDAFGRLVRHDPPAGAATELHYDGLSSTVVIGPPGELGPDDSPSRILGRRTNVFGELVEVTENTDTGTATTTYDYDPSGNLARVVNADGIETTFTHDWAGHRTSIQRSGSLRPWRFFYDLDGNMVAKTSPFEGDATLAPAYTTTWVYDELDRPISKRTPSAGQATGAGSIRASVTSYEYGLGTHANSLGRLSRVTLPFATIDYDYTIEGLVASEQRSFQFVGSKTESFSDTRTQTWTYNEAGLPAEFSTGDSPGGPTRLQYDYTARGLPIALTAKFPGWFFNTTQLATLQRNRLGKVISCKSGGSSTWPYRSPIWHRWSYDVLGRVAGHRVDGSGTITGENLAYDALSNLRSSTNLASGLTLQYGYDSQHQLATVSSSPNAAVYAANFQYTPGGRLTQAYVGSQVPGTDVLPREVRYEYAATPTTQRRWRPCATQQQAQASRTIPTTSAAIVPAPSSPVSRRSSTCTTGPITCAKPARAPARRATTTTRTAPACWWPRPRSMVSPLGSASTSARPRSGTTGAATSRRRSSMPRWAPYPSRASRMGTSRGSSTSSRGSSATSSPLPTPRAP